MCFSHTCLFVGGKHTHIFARYLLSLKPTLTLSSCVLFILKSFSLSCQYQQQDMDTEGYEVTWEASCMSDTGGTFRVKRRKASQTLSGSISPKTVFSVQNQSYDSCSSGSHFTLACLSPQISLENDYLGPRRIDTLKKEDLDWQKKAQEAVLNIQEFTVKYFEITARAQKGRAGMHTHVQNTVSVLACD